MEALILKSVSKVLKRLDEVVFFHRCTTSWELLYVAGGNNTMSATIHIGEGRVHIHGKITHSLDFNIYMDANGTASLHCKEYSPQYMTFGKTIKLGLTEEGFFQRSMIHDLSWTTFEEYDTLNKLRAFFDNEVRNRL